MWTLDRYMAILQDNNNARRVAELERTTACRLGVGGGRRRQTGCTVVVVKHEEQIPLAFSCYSAPYDNSETNVMVHHSDALPVVVQEETLHGTLT
jgi:hypothetical protein